MSQEQVNALQQALLASSEQVLGLSQQLDQLRADATASANGAAEQLRLLREEAHTSVSNLRVQVEEMEAAGRGGGDRGGRDRDRGDGRGRNRLINTKHFEPKVFTGKGRGRGDDQALAKVSKKLLQRSREGIPSRSRVGGGPEGGHHAGRFAGHGLGPC